MSSHKFTSDSGICLSAGKHKSKIPVKDSRSSSDSEHSSDEETRHTRRLSHSVSQIPNRVFRQNRGSDSSSEETGRNKPSVTDSGKGLVILLFSRIYIDRKIVLKTSSDWFPTKPISTILKLCKRFTFSTHVDCFAWFVWYFCRYQP